jgi:hypothetical protein
LAVNPPALSTGNPPGGFSSPASPAQGYPPTAPPGVYPSVAPALPGSEGHPWKVLKERPTIPLTLNNLAVSKQLYTRECIITAWHVRESAGGTLPANPQTDVDASSATAAAANNVTLPGVAGATTFITGFEITGDGATAGSIIAVTVTGILGGTKTYFVTIPTGAGVAIAPLIVEFVRPIPASGLNTAIVVNVPSFGVGNTNAAVTAHGFQQIGAAGGGGNSIADIYDGGDATGAIVASWSAVPFGQADCDSDENGIYCSRGVFVNIVQGQFTGAIWIKA